MKIVKDINNYKLVLNMHSIFALVFFIVFSGSICAGSADTLYTAGSETNAIRIIKDTKPYQLVPVIPDTDKKYDFAEPEDTPAPLLNANENEITLYLRDKGILSETMGDPVPWITQFIYPSGPSSSAQWEVELGGDITDYFYYQIDIVECAEANTQFRAEFIIDHDGTPTTVASQVITINNPLPPNGYYDLEFEIPNGQDLQTRDGDRLIFRITHTSGTKRLGIGIDGVDIWCDSRIKIVQVGPVACFTVDPIQGDLLTEFNVDASCSYDSSYPTPNLEVRWDWDNDGDYDTAFSTNKTASHKYSLSGLKSIKLQVRNPDGHTGAKIHDITIPIVIVDSFTTPDPAPAGVTWDGTHLWHSDGYNDKIFQLTTSGTEVKNFAAPCGDPMDLAWDGSYLRIIDAWGSDGKGNLVYKMDTEGQVFGSPVQVPVDISTGLTWDGNFLWGADGHNAIIRKLDPNTGDTIVGFRSPGYDPRGLAWDGQNLWNADFTGQKIYKFDVNGRILNTWPSPGSGPMGLTWDGKYLWSVDLNTYKIYKLADKIPTTITCELSKSSMIFGELLTVSGQISPPPGEAGKAVSIELTPLPAGVPVYGVAFADISGAFDFTFECGDIHSAGDWNVQTTWAGAGPFEGSASDAESLVLSMAETRVTLDATSQAIKIGDPVSISGKLTPQPDCGSGLENIPLTIIITGPGGTKVENVWTNDQFGHFLLENYDQFGLLGEYTFQANFAGNDSYVGANSEPLTVNVVKSAGYAIIVQGKISSKEGLASHNKTTQFVYKTLIDRGLTPDDIKYFNYNTGQSGVDGLPSKTAIQNAITQWARDKMNSKAANLFIVMIDHGLEDFFYIHPDTITAVELDSWLDTLQGALAGDDAAGLKIITLLGFCRAGSFLDNMQGSNRINIASAASGESSYKGPLDTDNIRDGEYFVSEFIKSISLGETVKQSFEEAVVLTETYTDSGTGDFTNGPFFDGSRQHPLLDDNGDGIGSNQLSGQENDDGAASEDLIIGVSSVTGNDPGDVRITDVTNSVFLGTDENTASVLWAVVDDNTRLRSIWVEVKPPGYNPTDPLGSEQVELDLVRTFGAYNSSTSRYEWANLGQFNTEGAYQILYFAKDDLTGNISPLMTSTAYRAKAGNSPPNEFNLIAPANDSTQLTQLILDWEDTTDPNQGDWLTYTVLLSKGSDDFSDPVRKEGLIYSTCLITAEDGLDDLSDYYWKVQAIDNYGAVRNSSVRVFHTNNTNPVAAWVYGNVFDYLTGLPISNAQVTLAATTFNTDAGGYYLGQVLPGSYTISASATGYNSQSDPDVALTEGSLTLKDYALTSVSYSDTDGDGLPDDLEINCTDPLDADTDDDGLADGMEDANHNGYLDPGETDPCDIDSDGDGIQDGTELGVTEGVPDPDGSGPLKGTDTGIFKPDQDPGTITNPLDEDTDDDGWTDGQEDSDHDGEVDSGEKDPNHFDFVCIPHIPILLF